MVVKSVVNLHRLKEFYSDNKPCQKRKGNNNYTEKLNVLRIEFSRRFINLKREEK